MVKNIEYMDDECRTCISAAFCGNREDSNWKSCDAYNPLPRVKNLEFKLQECDTRIVDLEAKLAEATLDAEKWGRCYAVETDRSNKALEAFHRAEEQLARGIAEKK